MKNRLIVLLCLPASLLVSQQAQDLYLITTQGGSSDGKTMSITWTIGDLVTETSSKGDAVTTQGFQQPLIYVKPVNPDQAGDDLKAEKESEAKQISGRNADFQVEVFPNPVTADITIQVTNAPADYLIEVFDLSGNLLTRQHKQNTKEVMNLSTLPAAQYVLRVSTDDPLQTKSFQLIKSR